MIFGAGKIRVIRGQLYVLAPKKVIDHINFKAKPLSLKSN